MSYRPQFPYRPAPTGCEDQRCQFSFDSTNTPFLTQTLASGSQIQRIPLNFDRDSEFFVRGISTPSPGDGGTTAGLLQFRLQDQKGNPLSDVDNSQVTTNFVFPNLYSATMGAGIVALDSDDDGVYVPRGGVWYLYLYNGGSGDFDLTTFVLNIHGVKRYTKGKCG